MVRLAAVIFGVLVLTGFAAGPARATQFQDCDQCPILVAVPPGTFTMGASRPADPQASSNEGPVHPVTIAEPILMGAYEVTYAEWDACVDDGGCNGYRPSDDGNGRGRRPVVHVSWDDVQAYLAWLGGKTGVVYRLPSEAEWEYAARAGTTTPWFTGRTLTRYQANFDGRANGATRLVGSYAPNAFGLYDMTGNVWELTQDCLGDVGDYVGAPMDGSARAGAACGSGTPQTFVRRGGDFRVSAVYQRSAGRLPFQRRDRSLDSVGFRVVRTGAPAVPATMIAASPAPAVAATTPSALPVFPSLPASLLAAPPATPAPATPPAQTIPANPDGAYVDTTQRAVEAARLEDAARRNRAADDAANVSARADYEARQAAYQAELARQRQETADEAAAYARAHAAWQAKVRACQAGDKRQCGAPEPRRRR